MKVLIKVLILMYIAVFVPLQADDVVTVKAMSNDISDNLDLEAVATIFGDSHNLQEFERKLNDPRLNISNLDLNGDGYVDYLRVMDASEDGVYVVVIQAVIARNMFQDVATIDVVKDQYGQTIIQVIGNIYLYGPNYIIQPMYATPPLILVWFSSPYYVPWFSPWYWDFYPSYYSLVQPLPVHRYHPNVKMHKNTYKYLDWRQSRSAPKLQSKISRDDYATKHPSFIERNQGMKNRHELRKRLNTQIPISAERKKAEKDWQRIKDRDRIERKEKNTHTPVPKKTWSAPSPVNRYPSNSQSPRPVEVNRPRIIQQPATESEEDESHSGWHSK